MSKDTRIAEFFNYSTRDDIKNWEEIVSTQFCGYLNKKCIKVRKSSPEISIGTCTVHYGKANQGIIICPHRLIEKRKIFIDCIHLLALHQPGNEVHVVHEINIPGGNVDYFLVSVKNKKVVDFVGIELQTMDTTGTVWPERQKLLANLKLIEEEHLDYGDKVYGMNWKMTAKTILVQLLHKIETFEHLKKHLVLVLQNHLLNYMKMEFSFSHLNQPPKIEDPMHIHSYELILEEDKRYHINMIERLSTDSEGMAIAMGLKAEARIDLDLIIKTIETKISINTLLTL